MQISTTIQGNDSILTKRLSCMFLLLSSEATLLWLQTTLDAVGLCCNGGHVDECGVCEGYGASCEVQILLRKETFPADKQCILGLIDEALQLREVITDYDRSILWSTMLPLNVKRH